MIKSYGARAVAINVSAAEVEEAPVASSPGTPAPVSGRVARAYDGFLGMPVWAVLGLMWLAGVALLGSSALVVYAVGSVLLRSMAGFP